ncbi:MAG: MFS transporter [Rhodoplanes sp.]|uniref:MFS transporter n=1 Tax=Rhodoplanes sp. TaxID=1968906 RepID=UPI0017FD359E|nr:MFS transporter [Rhodoplanes sp.]NVO14665.1 MFS transporter [Rhodoplanes sp.]
MTKPMLGVIVIAALASLFDAADAYLLGFAMPGIAKEFDLKPETLGLIASSTLLGMCVGSFFWGWVADKWGRKIAFTVTILMFSIFSGASGLAFSVGTLLGARFLCGVGIGGSIPVDASILAEFAPARIRGYSNGALPITWPLATFISSSLALIVLPIWGWRGLFLCGVVPALLVFWVRRNVPESPRWLVNRGRHQEARDALHYLNISDAAIERSRAAVVNEMPPPVLPPAVFGDLFTREMRVRTIHTWMLWILPLMASWGMNLWIPQLFVKLHGLPVQQAVANMLYISFFSVAGRLTVYLLSEKVGRKPFIVMGFTGAGVLLLGQIWTTSASEFFWVAAIYVFFMEMGLCGSTIYLPEVYPLHVRVLGASTAMGLGRIGGAIGGYAIGAFMGAGLVTGMWIFLATGCLIAGIATIWLGIEPKGQNLEELNKAGAEGAAKRLRRGEGAQEPLAA